MSDDSTMRPPPGWTIPPKPPLPSLPSLPSAANTLRRRSRRPSPVWRDARAWLVAYVLALTAIAFWPVPVDSGAGLLLRAISRVFPFLTYNVIEFGANILLFVPLGLLIALLLPRRRYLVVPIALIATVSIEGLQGVFLGARTSSVLDVVANTTGACIGLVLAEVIPALRRRYAPRS